MSSDPTQIPGAYSTGIVWRAGTGTPTTHCGGYPGQSGPTIRPQPEAPLDTHPGERPRILLIRPDHLGDVLLTRPAIDALTRALPEATLTVAVGPWGRPALGPRPAQPVLICPFPGFSRASLHPLQRYRLLLHYARLVRRERYTMAIIARPDHWWGALLAALAGIPTRIGYDVPETQPFLTLSVPRTRAEYPAGAGTSPSASAPLEPGLLETTAPSTNRLSAWRRRSPIAHPDVGLPQPAAAGLVPTIHDPQAGARPEALTTPHTAANALALAAVAAHSLGRDLSETASYPLPADAGPEERAAVDRLLAEAGVSDAPFVVLQPGAGSPLKAWHAERLAAVGAALANDLGARIVVSGSAAEHALAQQVCDALPSGAINLAGALKWTELEALLARAQVVVGVDSGPLHVAVAASTPSVALFGPADPAQFGPWGDAARHQVVTADLPCRPCRRLDWCALEPAGVGPPPCMRAITVEAVIQSARAALAEGKHGSETTD